MDFDLLRYKFLSFLHINKKHYDFKIQSHKSTILNKYKHFQNASFKELNAPDFNTKSWGGGISLFCYHYDDLVDFCNLGDYIQSIATKNALEKLGFSINNEFLDRDSLSSYKGDPKLCIMQGWFAHGYDFIPSKQICGIYVGTHFTKKSQNFFDMLNIDFKDFEIGCRDKFSLNYLKSKWGGGLWKDSIEKPYFSRCLTLTLDKRKPQNTQNKIFLTGLDEELIKLLPQDIQNEGIFINQQQVKLEGYDISKDWQSYYKEASNLLELYESKAKLVITSALHCAAPCVAMGIPVVLFCTSEEQKTRFSALDGILPLYSLEDLRANRVDFNPKSLDIEELKTTMLLNLKLSIAKRMGENVDKNLLEKTRRKIAEFKLI